MVSKSIVQSFSYQAEDAEIVEAAARLAKSDNVPFSQLILRLLKEEVRRKKAVGDPNPIRVSYNNEIYTSEPKKHLPTTLDQWIKKLKEMDNITEIGSIQGYHTLVAHKCKVRINQLKTSYL